MKKTFLHIDLDAFFASVEQLDDPSLKGKPVIVGGMPGDRRSVVSTCSYEARKYGVHSAMPVFQAYRLCPEGIFIHPRMKRYHEKSNEVMQIFHEYSPDVQQISVDEAFIDLTGTERLFGDPEETAKKIKKEVKERTGLTVSIGLASTKYCAKIASGLKKPDGFFAVPSGGETDFMLSLPLEKLWGAGTKTLERLRNSGIRSTKDIYARSENLLKSIFGNATGTFLYNAVRGNEYEDFNSQPKSRSISAETTYEYDLLDQETIEFCLLELCHTVMFRSLKEKIRGKSVSLKIRYEDFSTVSVQETSERYVSSVDDLFDRVKKLFKKKYDGRMGIRLFGVAIQNIEDDSLPRQGELFDFGEEKKRKVENAILKAEQKNPEIKITKARLLGKNLLILMTFILFAGIRTHISAKEKESVSDGAGTIIFDSSNLPIADSGSVSSLFSKKIGENEVEFLAEGYWKSTVAGTFSRSFGFGTEAVNSTKIPVFTQNVDLTVWFMLNRHWFFEAAFADEFNKNTVAAGYFGEGTLRSARISNRNIVFPEKYSVNMLNRGIGGGDNQAPGISFSWAGKKWQADAALRYDLLTNHEKTWYGKNSISDEIISLSDYVTGCQFVLPDSRLIQNINAIYVESYGGSYSDSRGKKYKKLDPSQYLLVPSKNLIILSKAAKAYRQNEKLPEVAVSFSCRISQTDLGTYGNEASFLGSVQKLFGSSVNLQKYSYAFFDSISGDDVLLVQSSSGFSPFVNASRYDCGISSNSEASIASKSSETENLEFSAVINDSELSFASKDFFYTDHIYADVFVSEKYSETERNLLDPSVRFPFAARNPGIYLGTSKNEDLVLRLRSYSPVSRLEIGTKAVPGTIRAYKNNIIDSGAKYDEESGCVTLSSGISSGDHIVINWSEESEDANTGAIAAAAGLKYYFNERISADFSAAGRWNYSRKKKFADADYDTEGYATAATAFLYEGENLTIKNAAGATLQNDNATGTFRILGMDELSSDTNYLSQECGIKLPPKITPKLNARTDRIQDRFPILKEQQNDENYSSGGITDGNISGYAIPISWVFTENDSSEYSWAAKTIDLPAATASLLSSSSEFSIAIKNHISATSDFDVYLQLGTDTSENFSSENSSKIPTWKISDDTATDVEKSFDPKKSVWQVVSVLLSEYDRSFFSTNGKKGARIIVVPKNNLISNGNKVGTILAGPYEFNQISFSVKATDKVRVSSYEKFEPLLVSSKIKDLNKNADGKTGKNYVQYFSWKYLETISEDDTIEFSKYFDETDFSKYKRLSFWINFKKSGNSTLTFSLERPSENSEKKSVEFNVSGDEITEGWQKVTINLEEKSVLISGKKIKAAVDTKTIPTKLKITVKNEAPAENSFGELSIDEIYLSEISPYTILQDKLDASWEKEGPIFAIGDKTLLGDVKISANGNGERIIESGNKKSKGNLSGFGHISGNVADIRITLEGTKSTDSKTKNFLSSAYHNFETAEPIMKILELREEYSFNEPEKTLEKNNMVGVSLKRLGIPFTISAEASADSDAYSKNQKAKTSASLEIKSLKLTAEADAKQKILTSRTKIIETRNYFSSWHKAADIEFSKGEKEASKREINFSSGADYILKTDTFTLKPNVSYSLKGNYRSTTSSAFSDSTALCFSVPLTFEKNFLEFSWKKSSGSTKDRSTGGNYSRDMGDVKKGMDTEKWFYKLLPFFDAASSKLSKEIQKSSENQTDDASKNSAGVKQTESVFYSSEYGLNWKRSFMGNRYDFFIPSGNSFVFSRDILSSDSLSDIYQLKNTIHYSALNIFGSKGNIPVLKFFEQDEYATSISLAVKIPKNNPGHKTYFCSGYFQSTFYMTQNNSLRSALEGTFQTKENWDGKYTIVWKRNAKNSITSVLAKYIYLKLKPSSEPGNISVIKTDSLNTAASCATSSDEITRKYEIEYLHQTDTQISKYLTINSSVGLGYSATWNKIATLNATASLGATIRF